MEICEKKNFFMITFSLTLEWHNTFLENLYYKSFLLQSFRINNQMDC